jgi:hypothetical protein
MTQLNFKAQVSIEMIMPDQAVLFLDQKYEAQRNIRPSYVARLAEEMVSGNWRLSSDPLVFIGNQLANGQHRLSAMIIAKKSLPFLIMRTDDKKLFDIMDSGIIRTMGDLAKFHNIRYGNTVAAATKIVVAHQTGKLTWSGGSMASISRSSQLDYMNKHSVELEREAAFVNSIAREKKYFPITQGIALALESQEKGLIEKAHEFLEMTADVRPASEMPRKMRARLMDNATSKARLPRSYIYGLMIKAFKLFADGKSISTLRGTTGEEFPQL